jgi:WD repeat-containing protein 45
LTIRTSEISDGVQGTILRIFSTSSCAKIAERRRGSENAAIFSLRFSPSGRLLACTSDKGSLHIFNVPNPRRPPSSSPPQSSASGATEILASSNPEAKNRWGFLSNIPFGPFQDEYSFTSTRFEAGDEPLPPSQPVSPTGEGPVLGTNARPMKGVIGWLDERSLVVVGAGQDARWEKFNLIESYTEGRSLVREGWKHYLPN